MTGLYLVGLICLHLALTLAILAAGAFGAVALGVRNRLLLLMIAMSTYGVLGTVVFWVYLASSAAGRVTAILLMAGSILVAGASAVRVRRQRRGEVLAPFMPPTAVFAAYSLLITAIGYLRGGVSSGDSITRNRFIAGLPTDSDLPYYLARQLQDPSRPLPHFLARPWQTSDRPPMQTGVYLLEQAGLGHVNFIHYEAVGIVSQSLWIFGVWAFMIAAGMPSRANAVALAVTGLSGFAIVNTFFVWPKLFPAAYLMVATAALLGPYLQTVRRSIGTSLAVGACIGCAMLGHPGSLLVVLGIVITLAAIRRWPSWRLLLGGAAAVIVLYGPWTLFIKYYNPPGDFLNKWQLAGIHNYLNKLSLRDAIVDAYRQLGWSGAVHNKLENLHKPFKDTWKYPTELWTLIRQHRLSPQGHADISTFKFEISAFYYYIPALGLMAFGMLALVLRFLLSMPRRRQAGRPVGRHGDPTAVTPDWRLDAQRTGLLALVCLLINYVVWSLILIGPGSTWNHAGSYYLELIGFCVGVIGWWLVSPRLCIAMAVVQCAITLWIYGVQPPVQVEPATVVLDHFLPSVAIVAVLALALLLAGLWWLGRQPLIGFETDPTDPLARSDPPDASRPNAAVGGELVEVGASDPT